MPTEHSIAEASGLSFTKCNLTNQNAIVTNLNQSTPEIEQNIFEFIISNSHTHTSIFQANIPNQTIGGSQPDLSIVAVAVSVPF